MRDLQDVLVPWFNAYRFLAQNVVRFETETGMEFTPRSMGQAVNLMDRWIVSALHSLIGAVRAEMAAYRLYTVVPLLLKFIETLTNWWDLRSGDDGLAAGTCA